MRFSVKNGQLLKHRITVLCIEGVDRSTFFNLAYFVVTMCDPDHHQEIDLQAPTSGHIQSPDYPSPSPKAGAKTCTVKLLVYNPASVLFIVDGASLSPERMEAIGRFRFPR